MNYIVNIRDDSRFEVIETKTTQVIKIFKTLNDAKYFMRSLNLGSGFDGWTPTFFLKNITIPTVLSDNAV